MKIVEVNSKKYEVIKDYRDALDIDEVNDKLTDYFKSFDYILGDYAYGKLRLKGFNDKSNKNFKTINDIAKIDEYIKNNCAFECRHFILKAIDIEKK